MHCKKTFMKNLHRRSKHDFATYMQQITNLFNISNSCILFVQDWARCKVKTFMEAVTSSRQNYLLKKLIMSSTLQTDVCWCPERPPARLPHLCEPKGRISCHCSPDAGVLETVGSCYHFEIICNCHEKLLKICVHRNSSLGWCTSMGSPM